jgi:yecA family protein
MKQELSYDDLQEVVSNHPGTGSAAEAHGLLSGMLCMDEGIDCEVWLANLFGPEENATDSYDRSILDRLFETTRRQLQDFDFSFELLLPDDDAPLEDRAQALGEWCQGFLGGLGYGAQGSDWPGECTELLEDFVQISRLDPEASGETDENAYAELSEYVRVGVQVIRSEFQSQTPQQLH